MAKIENKNDKFFHFHFDSNFSFYGCIFMCVCVQVKAVTEAVQCGTEIDTQIGRNKIFLLCVDYDTELYIKIMIINFRCLSISLFTCSLFP